MKWALGRVEIGVKADFGLPKKLSGPRANLKPSARRAGWWNSRISCTGLFQPFGTPMKTFVASLLYRVNTSSMAWTKSPPQEWRTSCKMLTFIFGKIRMRSSIADGRLWPGKCNNVDLSAGSYSVENRRLFSWTSPRRGAWLYKRVASVPTSFGSFLFNPVTKNNKNFVIKCNDTTFITDSYYVLALPSKAIKY